MIARRLEEAAEGYRAMLEPLAEYGRVPGGGIESDYRLQWNTDFRRDYRTEQAVYLNVDAVGDVGGPAGLRVGCRGACRAFGGFSGE